MEVTATDLAKAEIVLNTVCTMFCEYCSTQYAIEPVEIVDSLGHRQRKFWLPLLWSSNVFALLNLLDQTIEGDHSLLWSPENLAAITELTIAFPTVTIRIESCRIMHAVNGSPWYCMCRVSKSVTWAEAGPSPVHQWLLRLGPWCFRNC